LSHAGPAPDLYEMPQNTAEAAWIGPRGSTSVKSARAVARAAAKKRHGGQYANETGQIMQAKVEAFVQSVLPAAINLGSSKQAGEDLDHLAATRTPGTAFASEYRGLVEEDYYHSKKSRVDLVLYDPTLWPKRLAVELKHQESTGSTDVKLVGAVLSAGMYPCPSIVVYEGRGARAGVLQRCREEAAKLDNVIGFFTLEEFQDWFELQVRTGAGAQI
jgi:hypothetical protein